MPLAPTAAFIDGCWTDLRARFVVQSPVNQQMLAEVSDCGPREADAAVQAATVAFAAWRQTTVYQRALILSRWADLIQVHAEDLARLITWEMGKPIRQSRAEIKTAVALARWYAEECKR
ncbi:aldehyde dehydrogenase family protein, partial [Acidithiobacillus ferrooxidans]|nr:aldehyde dehydrogenase family protein [Acidithiobacillus ferrooxidans]